MRFPVLMLTGLLAIGPASLSLALPQTQHSGNPLWAVPLADLNATGERPIFTPTRHPPRPAAIEAPPISAAPQTQAVPDRPALSLLGTVMASDGTGGIGIFIDEVAKRATRLKTGEQHDGWALRRVQRDRVVLDKNGTRVTLVLAPGDSHSPAAPALPASAPQLAAEPAVARPRPPAPTPVAAFDWTSILRQGEAGSH